MKTTYRIEATNGKGLFWHLTEEHGWDMPFHPNFDEVKVQTIHRNFQKIKGMEYEFCELDNMNEYYCAFKSLNHMLEILPFDILEYLELHKLKIVEVKGRLIEADSQIFFKEAEVRKFPLTSKQIKERLAKEEARTHLKEEFRTLKISNYIIIE